MIWIESVTKANTKKRYDPPNFIKPYIKKDRGFDKLLDRELEKLDGKSKR